MSSAENELIKSFYTGFWTLIVVSIAFLILIVIMILSKSKLLERYNNSKTSNIFFWIVIMFMIILTVFFIYKLVPFIKDKKQVDNRDFIAITGTVVGFNNKTYYDDGKPTYSNPMIKIEETVETIVLHLNDVKINETYYIIYLENTRLAKIK